MAAPSPFDDMGDRPVTAVCTFTNNEGKNCGTAHFIQSFRGGDTKISLAIRELSVGRHVIEILQLGDISKGTKTCGPTYNPYNKRPGGPRDIERRIGDLGTVDADADGNVRLEIQDPWVSILGPNSVIGRSLVVRRLEEEPVARARPRDRITVPIPAGVAGAVPIESECFGVIGVAKQ